MKLMKRIGWWFCFLTFGWVVCLLLGLTFACLSWWEGRKWIKQLAEEKRLEALERAHFGDPILMTGIYADMDPEYRAWCRAEERHSLGRMPEPGDAELLGYTHEELVKRADAPLPVSANEGMT